MLNKSEGKIQREKIIIYLFFTMKENFCLIKINFKKSFKKRIRKMFAMVKLRNAPFINMNQTGLSVIRKIQVKPLVYMNSQPVNICSSLQHFPIRVFPKQGIR